MIIITIVHWSLLSALSELRASHTAAYLISQQLCKASVSFLFFFSDKDTEARRAWFT